MGGCGGMGRQGSGGLRVARTPGGSRSQGLVRGRRARPRACGGRRRRLGRRTRGAQAKGVGAVAGVGVAPSRRPAVLGVVVPAAPAYDPPRTRSRANRVGHCARIVAEPIPAPLLHIPTHVVKAPGIGQFLAHRVGHIGAVSTIPADLIQIRIRAGAAGKRRFVFVTPISFADDSSLGHAKADAASG